MKYPMRRHPPCHISVLMRLLLLCRGISDARGERAKVMMSGQTRLEVLLLLHETALNVYPSSICCRRLAISFVPQYLDSNHKKSFVGF